MISRNTTIIIFIFIIAVVLAGIGWYYFSTQKEVKELPIVSEDIPSLSAQATTTPETKTYRNEEWGFEFKYSNDLILNEGMFGSYYSKFNLVLFKKIGDARDDAVLVNIVLPEFVNTAFWRLQENTSSIIVGGVEGVKYEYKYQGFPHTTVILPLREYNIIIATGEGSYIYFDELNQIISSFKFLK